MQYSYTNTFLAAATFISSVSAHGLLTSPQPRLAGEAMKAACGQQVYNNQASDSYGNIQGELQVARTQSDYNEAACNIWLCKGYKFDDNAAANIQSWTAGQVVDFKFEVRAPHAGYANVSIVDTATNTIIGSPLKTYDDFGNNAYTIPANQTSFSLTMPSDLGSKCATAGACVIQHYWNAASIDQTYQSCVDFTIGGTGAGPVASSVASSVPVATVVPVSTAVAVVTSASAAPTTLQTMTRPATTSAAPAAVATDVAEDDCE